MTMRDIFRKLLWSQLLLVSVVGILVNIDFTYAEDAEDWMPDANLRATIIEEIGLPEGVPLTKEHLKWLTRLIAWDSEISDLRGIEHATNLINLGLCGNQISDLSPLADLVHLEGLSLCVNQISDISPLSELTNLTHLDLGANQISDITPLANLIQLERLNIGYNLVEDITPLTNLKQLKYLRADSNKIDNIGLLAGLSNLKELILTNNRISDFSPLANLINLEKLYIKHNLAADITPLFNLNLVEFEYDEVCEIQPLAPAIEERISTRTFPSICQAWDQLLIEVESEDERIAYHDLHFRSDFTLQWDISANEPTYGLSTRLGGNLEQAKAIRQQRLELNPNMISLFTSMDWYKTSEGAFPEDSDFWLRNADGQIAIKDVNRPWLEYQIDFIKPNVQDKLIEKIVGIAECGLFDGIMLDGFVHNATGFVGRELHPGTDEEIIAAVTRILREVRKQVRDDFLILVNANRSKPSAYTEYVNGSFMETGQDHPKGYTYRGLSDVEDTLLWNEENLREPQINCLEGWGIGNEPPDSPDNQQWMRVFTAMSLTHSDGYVLYNTGEGNYGGPDHEHIWFDFWDADLGQSVGEKAKLYENREGLFIREFTNGWAVYNRSGKTQEISLPMRASSVASGITNIQHTVPDLDGEIYLKQATGIPADVNGDGVVNILDLVVIANAFGKAAPDLNGDGVINIQDLVIVANAF